MALERRTPLKRGGALKRGAPLKRGSGLARGGALPQRSPKRIVADLEWARVKRIVAHRDRGVCGAARFVRGFESVPMCWGQLEPHHIWPTGEGGPRLDPANVLTLCSVHHTWAHSGNREKATLLGLITRDPARG